MHSDGSIVFNTKIDNTKVAKELEQVRRQIEKTQNDIAKKEAYSLPLIEKFEQLTEELKHAKEKLAEFKAMENAPASAIEQQKERVADLSRQWNAVSRKLDKYDADIDQANIDLAMQKEKAAELAGSLSKSSDYTQKMSSAMKMANKTADKLGKRITALAARVFVFTMITKALRVVRDYMGEVLQTNDEYVKKLSQLKGALLTAFQPLYETMLPAIFQLLDVATQLAVALAQVAAYLGGSSASEYAQSAEALYDEANAMKETGKAAKEAQKMIAGFDEINKASSTTVEEKTSDSVTPSFSAFDSSKFMENVDEAIVISSSVLLALGVILAFSGANIPLGIGMIAAGAVGLYAEANTNWSAMEQVLQGPVGKAVSIASGALLAIGAILTFSGVNVPLGIGMLALGAAGMATEAALNWDAITGFLKGANGAIIGVLGAAALAIGAILTFSGVALPLGIGLLAVGALALGSSVAANWDTISNIFRKVLEVFPVIFRGALLVIGAILAFSGVNLLLGIALIAAGAVGLVEYAIVNWDTVSEALKGPIGAVTAIVSSALLALGAILAFSGINLPLGIALMAAGAAGLATTVAANWNKIAETLKGPVGKVVAIASGALLALGLVLAFSGVALPLGIALIAAGAAGLVTVTAINWDSIKTALQGPIGKVVAIASGALLALGLILAFTGIALPLGIALIAAGAAGLVTVSTLNWDKIVEELQGPIGKVVAIASGVLLVLGLILAFTGVALPLGIALIAAGAAGLVTVTAFNWNAIKDKLSEAWEGIVTWYRQSVAPKLTLAYWKEKFANIGEGLAQKIKDGINAAISLFNQFINFVNEKMQFSWEGFSIAGKEIFPAGSFQLLNIPEIPKLAKGAVLPANNPFLAVVGDQKRGTNVEAPLATIQEAVALVMEDQFSGMMAGFDATVNVLREILEAVYGINVGDEVIAQAVGRYNSKMNIARGGV